MDFTPTVRLEAKRRANFRCVVCWEPWVEVHHILPKAAGGSGALDNAATLCGGCHQKYGGNRELRKQLREMRDWWWERCAATRYITVDSGMAQRIDEIHVSVLQAQKRQDDSLADVKEFLVNRLSVIQDKVMESESVSDAVAVATDAESGAPLSSLATALMRIHQIAEEEFAGVGQWYSSLSAEERNLFEQDVQKLAETANHVALKWNLFVKARWSCEQYDDSGELVFSVGANQDPREWIHAIARWNKELGS
jgi:HNH endonuclease